MKLEKPDKPKEEQSELHLPMPKKSKLEMALKKYNIDRDEIANKYPKLEEALDLIIKEDERDLKEQRDDGYVLRIITKYDELEGKTPFQKGSKTETEFKVQYKNMKLAVIVLLEKKGINYNQNILNSYINDEYKTMMAQLEQEHEPIQPPSKPVKEHWLDALERKQKELEEEKKNYE